MKVMHVINTV